MRGGYGGDFVQRRRVFGRAGQRKLRGSPVGPGDAVALGRDLNVGASGPRALSPSPGTVHSSAAWLGLGLAWLGLRLALRPCPKTIQEKVVQFFRPIYSGRGIAIF